MISGFNVVKELASAVTEADEQIQTAEEPECAWSYKLRLWIPPRIHQSTMRTRSSILISENPSPSHIGAADFQTTSSSPATPDQKCYASLQPKHYWKLGYRTCYYDDYSMNTPKAPSVSESPSGLHSHQYHAYSILDPTTLF